MGMKGAAVLYLPFGASGCGGLTAGNNSTQGSAGTLLKSAAKLPEPFRVPLPIPPVLEPIRTDATTDYYRITQKISQAEILPDLRTEMTASFPDPRSYPAVVAGLSCAIAMSFRSRLRCTCTAG